MNNSVINVEYTAPIMPIEFNKITFNTTFINRAESTTVKFSLNIPNPFKVIPVKLFKAIGITETDKNCSNVTDGKYLSP